MFIVLVELDDIANSFSFFSLIFQYHEIGSNHKGWCSTYYTFLTSNLTDQLLRPFVLNISMQNVEAYSKW